MPTNKKIIHRDLKGDNISIAFLGHHRAAKILDFGLAKAIQQESEATMSGSGGTQEGRVLGTPAYMSPEQALGEISKIDHRSDIYSIGVVFYQMLTGKLPFASNTPWGVMHKHIEETPDPLRNIAPGTPEKIEAVILRCLEKDRDKRYQSALDVKKNLEIAATGGDPDVTEDYASRQEEKTSATQDIPEPVGHTTISAEKPESSWANAILVTLLLVGVFGFFGYTKFGKMQKESQLVQTNSATRKADSLKKAEQKIETVRKVSAPKKNRKDRISKLLSSAKADVKANRLTSPKGRNAFEKYQEVLRLDSGNRVAMAGKEKIALKYVGLANGAMIKGSLDKAKNFLSKAESVKPDLNTISTARKNLTKKRSEGQKTSAKKVWSSLKAAVLIWGAL